MDKKVSVMIEENVQNRFAEETKTHQMKVELDQGVYRSILFRNLDSLDYHYRLTTFPGHLVISGDMGTFVFSRLYDMFEFFGEDGHIDLRYWSEKIEDGRERAKEFSFNEFKKVALDWFDQERYFYNQEFDCYDHDITDEDWDKDREDLILKLDWMILDNCPVGALGALREYETPRKSISFEDVYESDCQVYTYHFQWLCLAIRESIKQYREYERNKK